MVRTFLRFLMLLSLVVWIGGIVFFSSVVAPSVFGVLTPVAGGRNLAGDIVNRSLGALHWMGLVFGLIFLISSTALSKTFRLRENYLVLAMIALTAVSQFGISRRMATIRAEVGQMELSRTPQAGEFDRLHRLSVMTEGAVLLLGLGAVGFVSKKIG